MFVSIALNLEKNGLVTNRERVWLKFNSFHFELSLFASLQVMSFVELKIKTQNFFSKSYKTNLKARSKWTEKIFNKIFPFKSIGGVAFSSIISPLVSEKFCSRYTPSGPTGSNNTILKTVSLPGAESIAVVYRQTDRHFWIL